MPTNTSTERRQKEQTKGFWERTIRKRSHSFQQAKRKHPLQRNWTAFVALQCTLLWQHRKCYEVRISVHFAQYLRTKQKVAKLNMFTRAGTACNQLDSRGSRESVTQTLQHCSPARMTDEFQQPFFSCFNDMKVCLITAFVPCYQGALNTSKVDERVRSCQWMVLVNAIGLQSVRLLLLGAECGVLCMWYCGCDARYLLPRPGKEFEKNMLILYALLNWISFLCSLGRTTSLWMEFWSAFAPNVLFAKMRSKCIPYSS